MDFNGLPGDAYAVVFENHSLIGVKQLLDDWPGQLPTDTLQLPLEQVLWGHRL